MLRIFRHYVPGLTPVLFFGDLAVIAASVLVTEASGIWVGGGPHAPRLLFIAGITTFLLYLGDLYNPRLPLGRREMVARLLICQAAAAPLVAAGGYALPSLRLGRQAFLELGIIVTLGLLLCRAAWLGPWSLARMTVRVLVVGSGPL